MDIRCPVYIKSVSQISIQQPMGEEWIETPVIPDGQYNEAIDPSFRDFLSAGEARRLGKIMKRAVATSVTALEKAGITCPDAIITATGLGCVKNTELFLTDLCNIGESLLKPTQFMQSTHNTIGSLVAILNKCHGYNVTYAHKGVSMEVALLDAVMQMSLGDIGNALVGAHDEMTPLYYQMLCRIGFLGCEGMVTSGETAVAMTLDSKAEGALCRIADMGVYYRLSESRIDRVMQSVSARYGRIDAVMAGYNGTAENDAMYDRIINRSFPGATVMRYKNLFGEGYTASAFGIYTAATIIDRQACHPSMIMCGNARQWSNILCLNCSDGKDVAYVLLSKLN